VRPNAGNVAVGSVASILPCPVYVRLPSDSDRAADIAGGLKWANNGSRPILSISSSARPGPHFRITKNAPISGAGDLISTTTESSMASNPWRTPLGCRQTSPGPMMNSSEPTVDFTLPFTT
jgi:hypothetical protein